MKRWPTKPLSELGELRGGGTPSRRIPEYFNGDIPWITGADVTGFYVSKAREFITREAIKNSTTTLLPKNSVLVVTRTGVGKIGIAATPVCISQDLTGVVCRDTLLPEYLARFLLADTNVLMRAVQGATILGITRDFLKQIEIPVPPLLEQKRIVRLLDEGDELRTLRAQADRRTADFIPALFNEMFGNPSGNTKRWPVVPAGDLMVSCEYGCSKKANEDLKGVPMLRMGNVTSAGLLDLTNLKHALLDKDELAKYRLVYGDVLFNRTNSRELVGKTGMWDGDFEAVAASYFIRIRFDLKREHPQHFTTFMNLPQMKQRLMQTARGAIGQSNINAQELKAIPVPLPPLSAQKKFAQRVAEIREIEASQAESRAHLDSLFASLMDRAFKREL